MLESEKLQFTDRERRRRIISCMLLLYTQNVSKYRVIIATDSLLRSIVAILATGFEHF